MATRFKSVIVLLAAVMVVGTSACAIDPASRIDATVEAGIAATMVGVEIEKAVKATQAAPAVATDHLNWAKTYLNLGEYENAIQEFDKVIQLDPGNVLVYNDRGYAYGQLGQDAKADADKAKACSLDKQWC